MKNNYPEMPKKSSHSDKAWKKRSDYESRKKRFFTVVFDDENLKAKLQAVAEAENRSANNFFNEHLADQIGRAIDARFEKLPDDVKRRALSD